MPVILCKLFSDYVFSSLPFHINTGEIIISIIRDLRIEGIRDRRGGMTP